MSTSVNTPSQEMIVRLQPEHGYCWYEGTRAQLEAEGLIPESLQWPKGYTRRHWNSGMFQFLLFRKRAPGLKGRHRDGDWWALRWRHQDHSHVRTLQIRLRLQELEEMTRRCSPEGEAEVWQRLSRCEAADRDARFQAFKALVPGLLQPPRPRRRAKGVVSQEGLSNGGEA